MWSLGLLSDATERMPSASLKIRAERVNFWAAIRRHCTVHNERESVVHMLCLSPLPEGYLVLPMRLLDADIIVRDHPEVSEGGLLGEWKIDDEHKKGTPRLQLLRTSASPQQFLSMLQSEQYHPPWLWPAYACVQGQTAESLVASQ